MRWTLAALAGRAQGNPVMIDFAPREGVAYDDGMTVDEEDAMEETA